MVSFDLRQPETTAEWEAYYELRWRALREPWGQPKGSERDALDASAVHRAAWINHIIVAVGRIHWLNEGEAQIRYMAVADEYRRQGLGRVILQALEGIAQQRGVHSVILNARNPALGFYEAQGYRAVAKGFTLYGEIPHTVMTKTLPPSEV